jgi:hypothetical protein
MPVVFTGSGIKEMKIIKGMKKQSEGLNMNNLQ